ncbi:MAG: tRNA (adenosine(37)-N6)-threonylcarbamoyltransferase complex ATPase subunit type 1 TsaE [Candidatus Dormibacteraeota bacterium]|nr:tRNA (adenosine(37)-N6)-threonylcarbamoyltransferase complex ATPase subunit type 1 TsaE [Candidatus Dormibacteraeota bacterium]
MTGGLVRRCQAERDTVALGERIGARLQRGDLLSLSGPLGAGKTVLVRGMAVGVGADPRAVRSPTFVLHQVYQGRALRLHHIDLYRLGSGADTAFLDIDGLLEDGAVAVEWGELGRLDRFRPARISVEPEDGDARAIALESGSPPRLAEAWGAA